MMVKKKNDILRNINYVWHNEIPKTKTIINIMLKLKLKSVI